MNEQFKAAARPHLRALRSAHKRSNTAPQPEPKMPSGYEHAGKDLTTVPAHYLCECLPSFEQNHRWHAAWVRKRWHALQRAGRSPLIVIHHPRKR